MNTLRVSLLVAIVGCAGAALELTAQSARTASPVQFALTEITPEQTARLSISAVVNGGFRARGCDAILTFVDAHGQTLVNSDGHAVESHVTLRPGESAFLDLGVTDTGRLDASRRLNFRPVVFDGGGSGGPSGPCLPQLEIIDTATQATLVINPGVAVGGWNNHNETLVRDTDE